MRFEQIHFNGNSFVNKCCRCNEVSLYLLERLFQCMSECDDMGFKTRMLSCIWTKTGKLAPQGSCDSLPVPRTRRKCEGPPCSSIGTISKFPGSRASLSFISLDVCNIWNLAARKIEL